MNVTMKIQVEGCVCIPVVDGEEYTAWPFNDIHCSTIAEWYDHCLGYMKDATNGEGQIMDGWEQVANQFWDTSQMRT